jgi:hypothetical protein
VTPCACEAEHEYCRALQRYLCAGQVLLAALPAAAYAQVIAAKEWCSRPDGVSGRALDAVLRVGRWALYSVLVTGGPGAGGRGPRKNDCFHMFDRKVDPGREVGGSRAAGSY